MATEPVEGARRELKTRQAGWARNLAAWLATTPITPNSISVLSILFAILGAVCLLLVNHSPCQWCRCFLWFAAAASIQLRLVCNLLDGMVAIEGGKKSATGGLYNEIPDRIADLLFIAAAGYTASLGSQLQTGNDSVPLMEQHVLWAVPLGWLAASLALIAPYIRVLGGTLTGTQSFIGPMAKQHRMALLTFACLLSIVETLTWNAGNAGYSVMWIALLVMSIGTFWTCIRRTSLIAGQLQESQSPH